MRKNAKRLSCDPTGALSSMPITRYLDVSMVFPCNRGTINMFGRMNMQMLLTAVLRVHNV